MTDTHRTQLPGLVLVAILTPAALTSQVPAGSPAPEPLAADAPFTVAVSTTTIEGAPVYVADAGPRGDLFQVINGGVRNLVNGTAHAATNAETQFLIAGSPKVRILLTVAEGLYRIVAKRSSGIRTLADLKGKRVTVPRDTSAHYSLVRLLAGAGLSESDVTLVALPRDGMAEGLVTGQADAISMWEPEAQKAVERLGADAVIFQDNGVYRELFSLYTTTDVLANARRRRELVEVVRAIRAASGEIAAQPTEHFPLIARTVNQSEYSVGRGWPHHAFPMAVPADMLDVLVEEEQWVAARQNRAARSREDLAAYFDTSVLQEAQRR